MWCCSLHLAADVPLSNPALVLQIGATTLKTPVDPAVIGDVLITYNAAVTKTFYVSVTLAAALNVWRFLR